MEVGKQLYSKMIVRDVREAQFLEHKLNEFIEKYELYIKIDNKRVEQQNCFIYKSLTKNEISICPAENATLHILNKIPTEPMQVMLIIDDLSIIKHNDIKYNIFKNYQTSQERT